MEGPDRSIPPLLVIRRFSDDGRSQRTAAIRRRPAGTGQAGHPAGKGGNARRQEKGRETAEKGP